MPLRDGVLGLVMERRAYGYELVQRFNERVGPSWRLNASAVYNALDDLEERGAIRPVYHRRPTLRSAPRIFYEATEAGIEAFEEWIEQPPSSMPLREELLMRMAVARPSDLPCLIEQTLDRERECLERLEAHAGAAGVDQLVAEGRSWHEVAAKIARDADVAMLAATIEWLRTSREVMRAVVERDGLQR